MVSGDWRARGAVWPPHTNPQGSSPPSPFLVAGPELGQDVAQIVLRRRGTRYVKVNAPHFGRKKSPFYILFALTFVPFKLKP
jgi:hypothetical protein